MINENIYTQLSIKLDYSRDEIKKVVQSQFSLFAKQLAHEDDKGENIRFMYLGAFKKKAPNIHEYVKEIKALPPKERQAYKEMVRTKYIENESSKIKNKVRG